MLIITVISFADWMRMHEIEKFSSKTVGTICLIAATVLEFFLLIISSLKIRNDHQNWSDYLCCFHGTWYDEKITKKRDYASGK